MFANLAMSDQVTPRLLSVATLTQLAGRFCLPKYSALAMMQEEGYVAVTALYLWRCLFPAAPVPIGDAWEVEEALLWQINTELFPLNIEAIDELIYASDEHPLYAPIYPGTYGLPWEAGGLNCLTDDVQPLAAAAWTGLPPAEYMAEMAFAGREAAADWLAECDVQIVDPEEDYLLNWGSILAELNALPEPLNGLGVAYRCLLRNTGNTFFDDVPATWHGEYDNFFDGRPFSLQDIHFYAAEWRVASPEIDKLNAYRDWWSSTPNARAHVLEALRGPFLLEDFTDDADGDASE